MPINPNVPASEYTQYLRERSTIVSRKWVPPDFSTTFYNSQIFYSSIAKRLQRPTLRDGFLLFSLGSLNVAPKTSLDFGTGDFTIEWFMYPTNTTAYQSIFSFTTGGIQVFGVSLGINQLRIDNNFASGGISNRPISIINRWYHCAVSRASGVIKIFLDGQLGLGNDSNITATLQGHSLQIGNYNGVGSGGPYPFTGRMTNFRIIKGTALYARGLTYTRPTLPLSGTGSSLLLLTNNNNPYGDSSPDSANSVITIVGTPPAWNPGPITFA